MYKFWQLLDEFYESIGFAVELAVTALALLGLLFLGWCVKKKGDTMTDKFKLFWGLYGKIAGSILILLPIVWDVLWIGARQWQAWQIETTGVLLQLGGVACILLSWYCDESLR